ncbi:hypothetical protein AERYTH_01630 [Aeromicrobium erythreum]|uniref:Uncharacterized protein n=1 Tax=Aeromicrobium erythreum TaxID=2041 RepID=A0A0U4CRG5_9ACTN|nr:hypothetical protein AERYTH_01630 [Aeromicrobium erythreum]
MTGRKRLTLVEGTVFSVPLGDGRTAIGQIATMKSKKILYLVLFEQMVADDEVETDWQSAIQSPIVIAGSSLDARLYHGYWTILGVADVPDPLHLPASKVAIGMPPTVYVTDYCETRRRPATANEAEILPNITTVSPMRLEKAFKALHGLEPWLEVYDPLLPANIITESMVFGEEGVSQS